MAVLVRGAIQTLARLLLRLGAILSALALAGGALAQDAPAAPDPAPRAVIEAIEAAPSPGPEQVIIGAYINDIQQIDFKANNYIVDLYVWFRWKDPELDPSKTMEFMNRFASDSNLREDLYEEPQKMPDGTLYAIIRYQGLFSTKFSLETYPFDMQYLRIVMEDTVSGVHRQIYVPDRDVGVTMNPDVTLPGFTVGAPTWKITDNTYPTDFGDLGQKEAEIYSRVVLTVPVTRPALAMSLKTFVPILLIVACASFVFFVRPRFVEGRIGLGITALLTLVALQLTATSALPDVDYLTMLDKMFLLAYLFIIITLGRVVLTSWRGTDARAERAIARGDHTWAAMLITTYLLMNLAIIWLALS